MEERPPSFSLTFFLSEQIKARRLDRLRVVDRNLYLRKYLGADGADQHHRAAERRHAVEVEEIKDVS